LESDTAPLPLIFLLWLVNIVQHFTPPIHPINCPLVPLEVVKAIIEHFADFLQHKTFSEKLSLY